MLYRNTAKMFQKKLIISLIVHLIFLTNFVTPEQSNVFSYNPAKFNKQVEELDGNFIMFYAPWCKHCTVFEPIWEELASMVNTEGSKFAIAKIDCTVYESLCNDHDITGYPSLLYFSKNNYQAFEYRGTRDLPSLTLFLSEMFNRQSENEEVELKSDEVKVHSGMAILTDYNIEKYIAKGQHFIMFYAPWCKNSQLQATTWSELAMEYATNDTVKIGKVNCRDYLTTCQNFDVKEYPQQLWILDGKVLSATTTVKDLSQLKHFINQMARPENHDPEKYIKKKRYIPVVRISENTFDMYMKKDLVFINFYVPWCAHCMQLLPSWLQLGHKFENNSKIIIADVDCSQSHNLCLQEEVNQYPTLVLYRNSEVIYKQKGSIPIEELVQIIEANLTKLTDDSQILIKDEL